MSKEKRDNSLVMTTSFGTIDRLSDEAVGIILPTRGRPKHLRKTLESLHESSSAFMMEVIIVCDDDLNSFEIAQEFIVKKQNFYSVTCYLVKRLYPVNAFIFGYEHMKSDIFMWTNDECEYQPLWLINALRVFGERFPDEIGVLSLYKHKKAGLGLSSKKFVAYNNGEWFHDGYTVYYPDDELTCRAILLGRYAHMQNPGVFHDIEVTKTIPVIPPEIKIEWKRTDRGIFYERSETNFGLSPEKIYEWKGFREINESLKGEM